MHGTFQVDVRGAKWATALACLSLLCLAGCGVTGENAPALETIVTLTSVLTATPVIATPAATPESTPEGPITLTVWWPEPLAPINNDDASLLLTDQVDNFELSQPDVRVEIRLKQVEDVGGIMETLRSASLVAPDALPDLTMLRRDDLLAAVQEKLIQPLGGTALPAVRTDLYPAALELGLINRQLYGLPYALDIEHMAYKSVVMSGSFAHFDDVLRENQKYVFPAAVSSTSNDMLLLQYLSAGGTLTQINAARLDANALHTVFAFYEQAVAKGLIDSSVLNYAHTEDYEPSLVAGQTNAALVTSSQYLDLEKRGQSLAFAPIPLAMGDPTTTVDGWMWVMITPDKTRQAAALKFLEWLMDAGRQAAYAQEINVLPSRRAAIQQWGTTDYPEFANRLLLNARIPIVLPDGNVVMEAMQSALAALISGQRTADEAVQDVLNQIAK